MNAGGKVKRGAQKHSNLLIRAINDFLKSAPTSLSECLKDESSATDSHAAEVRRIVTLDSSDLPKRYTIYEPLLLLPANFATHSSRWRTIYQCLSGTERLELFNAITTVFRKAGQNVTHVAFNAPIEQIVSGAESDVNIENVMRAPVSLQPVYGDFGPIYLLPNTNIEQPFDKPSQYDFEAALWVESSQLSGVRQVWAPRWTMFSRGNIREKARILSLSQHNTAPFPGLSGDELEARIGEIDVLDMYVGIGYFAIPFLKRGVRRVFGWEINGWSVEGLRRGCEKNGFKCEIVKVDDANTNNVVERTLYLLAQSQDLRCVAFWGDNKHTGDVLEGISEALRGRGIALSVRHCNLGLLPTSSASWEGAVRAIDDGRGGWLHVHENAGIQKVEDKRLVVVRTIAELARQAKGTNWQVQCEHTEMVKTYAPGVGHFVFDVKVWPS